MNLREYLRKQEQVMAETFTACSHHFNAMSAINEQNNAHADEPVGRARHYAPNAQSVLLSMAANIINDLFGYAKVKYGSVATKAPINMAHYRERFFPWMYFKDENHSRERDRIAEQPWMPQDIQLVELWEQLERDFSDGKGREKAFENDARELKHALQLNNESEIRQTKRGVVISVMCHCDAGVKSFDYGFSYYTQERYDLMLKHLSAFAQWSENDLLREAINSLKPANRYVYFNSRDRRGIDGILSITHYRSTYELCIAPAIAEQLNLFIATYGNQNVNLAA